ncbi:AAA family ATPase [Arthrobacter sp. StoSoilB22]|uniref:McrB family protein n=1 Tax=Arthrobacter sp. StoSoilB22 TaxID=2830996 RepID=UPI001CC3AE9D|nr:AAA family ATPase [Arthrobacter sp. StoSoilB22]
MGPQAQRKNDHYFAAQQPATQYPLWSPGRAFATEASNADLEEDLVLIIKDASGGFHGRWIPADEIVNLPSALRHEVKSKNQGVWSANMTPEEHPSDQASRVIAALRSHHNVLLYGPPATGKTRIISEVLAAFGDTSLTVDTESERRPLSTSPRLATAWATFHQSYSYEDFLIGVRPENLEDGKFTLQPSPGILLELAEWARQENSESLLVIDEINRGNVSKIFGEFITFMEPDKRLQPDGSTGKSTISIRLPFVDRDQSVSVTIPSTGRKTQVPNPFTMPYGVYTLATMNSVDKSVAPLDAAIRRRFHVIDLRPDFSIFENELAANEGLRVGCQLLSKINRRVSMYLGPDHQFGQWYLAGLEESNNDWKEKLAQIWLNKVFPQLEEYFIGRSEQLLSILSIDRSLGAVEVHSPTLSEEDLGGSPVIQAKTSASPDEVLLTVTNIIEH